MGTGLEPRSGARQSSNPPLAVAHRLVRGSRGRVFAVLVFLVSGSFRAGVAALGFCGAVLVAASSRATPSEGENTAPALEPGGHAPAPATTAPSASPPPNPPQAAPPADANAPALQQRAKWYGWQILLSDVASLSLIFALPQGTDSVGWKGVGVVTFFAVPPLIHFANGNVRQGFGSLGLRVLLPPAGAVVGYLVGTSVCEHGGECESAAAGWGAIGGVVAAMVADSAGLAFKHDRRVQARVRWRPVVTVANTETRLGVAGSF